MSEQDSDIPPKYSIGFFRSFARAFAPALVVLMFAPLLPMTELGPYFDGLAALAFATAVGYVIVIARALIRGP